jgi:hypothetical protein
MEEDFVTQFQSPVLWRVPEAARGVAIAFGDTKCSCTE